MLVLVATIPSKAISFCRSTISSSCVNVRSGAILRYRGFHLSCVSRIAIRVLSIFFNSPLFCSSRRFGVFGLLTFTMKKSANS